MDIRSLKGVGPKKAEVLATEASIETIEDLLYYIPRRYIDRSTIKKIADCFINDSVTVLGTVIDVRITGRQKKFLEIIIDDGTDSISGVFFGGIQFLQKKFQAGDEVIFSGKVQFYRSRQIVHPEFDFIDDGCIEKSINTARIIPLYHSTEKLKNAGLDSRGFRRLIREAIDHHIDTIRESLPSDMLARQDLPGIQYAVKKIHFPDNFAEAENSRRRLAFNEMFFLSFYLQLSKTYVREKYSCKRIEVSRNILEDFIRTLPFRLTPDQEKASQEILADLDLSWPMNRLLQGDVGSGKTVVGMIAALYTVRRELQVAFMAPTEILAVQHYNTLRRLYPPDISIDLLTGSRSASEKNIIADNVSSGKTQIIVGTHALIEDSISFDKLGLIIIDEQHRFGVTQRARLRSKGNDVDLLVMTATPIPRSLYMTLYGDLDVSVILSRPSDRGSITTLAFPESRLSGVYNSLTKYISQGRQIYYVVPLIEESEKTDLKSAIEVYEHLKTTAFPSYRIEMIHGRMPQSQKDNTMDLFRNGSVDILVATTVIEVGIDVPNASVIVIHHAERFGLSQLHQLRGRVGRGEHKSFCVLVHPDDLPEDALKRINVLLKTDDGFVIAEEDLKLRGAGNLIGVRQHGHSGDFEFTNLVEDLEIILCARKEAENAVKILADKGGAMAAIENGDMDKLTGGIRTKKILGLLS